MKKYIVVLVAVMLTVACKKNEVEPYSAEGTVYFQLHQNWANTTDSLLLSFANIDREKPARMGIRVNLLGHAENKDRKFSIRVNEKLSDAVANVHYSEFPKEYTIAANEYHTIVPIDFIYTRDLDDHKRYLYLELVPTSDLGLGIEGRLNAKIMVTNMMLKPEYYDTYLKSLFGEYSEIKHRKIIDVIGEDFPETREEYLVAIVSNRWKYYAAYMKVWFEENPTEDENGDIIKL